jgi:hypothetical protein
MEGKTMSEDWGYPVLGLLVCKNKRCKNKKSIEYRKGDPDRMCHICHLYLTKEPYKKEEQTIKESE